MPRNWATRRGIMNVTMKNKLNHELKVLGALVSLTMVLAACGTAASSASSGHSATTGSTSIVSAAKKEFPSGVTLVSSQPPGGLMYIAAEAIQPYLQNMLGVPVTIRQMPGAGGKVAANYVYNNKSSSASSTILPLLIPNYAIAQVVDGGKFDLAHFIPLGGMFGNDTSIFVAKAGSSLKNYSSLANSKSTLTIGVAGFKSSAGWLSSMVLANADHINVKPISFTTGSQAINALLSGAVDLASVTRALALPLIAAKKVQPVLQFAPKALSYLPGTESIAQAGHGDQAFYNLIGVVGAPTMSSKATSVLAQALGVMSKNSRFISKAKKLHLDPVYASATQWGKEMNSQLQLIKSRISILGVG